MDETLSATLSTAMSLGLATSSQAQDVMSARQYMDNQRGSLLATYPGQTVAVAEGTIFAGADLDDVNNQIQTAFPGAVMYAEDPITDSPVPIS